VTRDPAPVMLGVRDLAPEAEGSSREWDRVHPEEDPVKTIGWQSCPAAMSWVSEVNTKERKGSDGERMEIWAAGGEPGPEG
jgi:hypothetical protein